MKLHLNGELREAPELATLADLAGPLGWMGLQAAAFAAVIGAAAALERLGAAVRARKEVHP